MCRFGCLDFDYSLKCPVDKAVHEVRFHAYPHLRGHTLHVIACSAVAEVERLTCGKQCRALLEAGHYWQRIHSERGEHARQ